MRAVMIVLLLAFITPATIQGDQDNIYRKIYKVGYHGNYVITGEARPTHGSFFYTVEDGHVQFIKEKEYKLKGKNNTWNPFKIMINIPDTALPDNGMIILTLYERNANGELIHSCPVVLEQIYH